MIPLSFQQREQKLGINECDVTKQWRVVRGINEIREETRPLVNFAFKREEKYKHHDSCLC